MSYGIAPSSSATSLTQCGRHEMEHRERIDEAADQPGASDAIDLRPLARHPHARLGERDVDAWRFARHQRSAGRREGFDPALEDGDVDPFCRKQRRSERADIVAVDAIDDHRPPGGQVARPIGGGHVVAPDGAGDACRGRPKHLLAAHVDDERTIGGADQRDQLFRRYLSRHVGLRKLSEGGTWAEASAGSPPMPPRH